MILLIKKIINSIVKIFLELFVFDRKIRRILKGQFAKVFLKKYVDEVISENKNKDAQIGEIKEYTIWQFWDKGLENAPKIVKRCIESIDKYEPNVRHIILNLENIKDYIDIPQKYYDLLKSSKMKMAHFSDILRTYLLVEYGGCWIDSTVFLTDKLPEYIKKSDLFLFQNYEKADLDGLVMTNYFIHSKPNCKLLLEQKDALEKYWQENDCAYNYFFYMHIFTMLTKNKTNFNFWKKVPFVSFIPVQHFQEELKNEFDELKWCAIKNTSSIHKLSYKEDVLNCSFEKNTFYAHLLEGKLND